MSNRRVVMEFEFSVNTDATNKETRLKNYYEPLVERVANMIILDTASEPSIVTEMKSRLVSLQYVPGVNEWKEVV